MSNSQSSAHEIHGKVQITTLTNRTIEIREDCLGVIITGYSTSTSYHPGALCPNKHCPSL